jgi:hypothetical protein
MSELKLNNFVEPLEHNIGRIILENTHPLLYGSTTNKSMIYKGDIDLLTTIEHKNKDHAFAQIKDILRNIKKLKNGNVIVGEIKFGVLVDIKNQIEKLTKTKASTIKNYSKIEELVKNSNKNLKIKIPTNIQEYYILKDELRDLYTLRWNADQILNGDANEYLKQLNPIFKIDFEFWIGAQKGAQNGAYGNYIECSNYIILGESSSDEEFTTSLKDNILKTLYVNTNYYKVLKRLYSYYRSIDDKQKMDQLIIIINNPQLGALYSIISQLKVLETVAHYSKKINNKKFKCSLDYLKWYTQYLEDQDKLNMIINKLKKADPLSTINQLEILRLKLMHQLNEETLKLIPLSKIKELIPK